MTKIVEITLRKYQSGTLPSDGKLVWGRFFLIKDADAKSKAIKRLVRMIESCDSQRCRYVLGDTLRIVRETKGGAFNQIGDLVYQKDISLGDKDFHRRAGVRLANYLSSIDNKNDYFCKVDYVEIGTNCYQLFYRNTELLGLEDKRERIKRLIAGRRSALSRSINKAKSIRQSHLSGLFPLAYKEDPRYIRIFGHIMSQRLRLKEAKRMTVDEIPSVTGRYHPSLSSSLEKISRAMG